MIIGEDVQLIGNQQEAHGSESIVVIGFGYFGCEAVSKIEQAKLADVNCICIPADQNTSHAAGFLRDIAVRTSIAIVIYSLAEYYCYTAVSMVTDEFRRTEVLTIALVMSASELTGINDGLRLVCNLFDAVLPLDGYSVPREEKMVQLGQGISSEAIWKSLAFTKGLSFLLSPLSQMSLSIEELRAAFRGAGIISFGFGCGEGDDGAESAALCACNREQHCFPLIDAKEALVSISGGTYLTLHQVSKAMSAVVEELDSSTGLLYSCFAQSGEHSPMCIYMYLSSRTSGDLLDPGSISYQQ